MRIVLTGATGFIGRRLATRLLADGHSVVALVRREAASLPAGVERRVGALADMDFLRASLADAEAVCHLAGEVKSFTAHGFYLVNEGLTAALAEGVRRFAPAGTPLLYVSSQAAGGPCGQFPGLRETDQPAPVSQYGFSKLLGERAVQTLASERTVAVARPAMTYGPGDWAFVPLYRLMACGLLPALGTAGQRFSIVYVDDLVHGLVLALEAACTRNLGGTFHFAGAESFAWEEYAAIFAQTLGRRVRVLRPPAWAVFAAAVFNTLANQLRLPTSLLTLDKHHETFAGDWLLDATATQESLGWTPQTNLALGAREAVAWCRSRGLF
jgi:dihydroflavonol-4-reductase